MTFLVITKYLVMHFIADFLLQSDEMATKKSSNGFWLLLHCVLYGMCFILLNPIIGLIVGFMHFLVDFPSSMLTSYFHKTGQRHWFFTTIGFDQLLHIIVLIRLLEVIPQ